MATSPADLERLLADDGFVRKLARSLIRDESAADDVAQTAWIAALTRPPNGDPRRWFATVVRNLARSRSRTEGARTARERAVARDEATASVAELAEREATRRRVVDLVLALDEPYRTVVVLRYFDELEPRRIAAQLGVPVETVKTRLKRALEKLRAMLDDGSSGDRGAWHLALAPLARVTTTTAPLIAGTILMSTTIKLLLGAAAVGVAAWFFVPSESAGVAVAPPLAASATAPDPLASSLALEPAPALAAREQPDAAPDTSRAVAQARLGATTRLVGRLLQPDGSPAAGAIVELTGRQGSEVRVREHGLPTEWTNPAPVAADAEGRFEVSVTPPLAMQYMLDATLVGCARLRWRWGEFAERTIDLGDVRFQRACTIVARVLDTAGEVRPGDYVVAAQPAVEPKELERDGVIVQGIRDPNSYEHVLESVPEGRVRVTASSQFTEDLGPQVVDAKPGEIVLVDFVDASPAQSTRIVVTVSNKPFRWIRTTPSVIRLERDGAETRSPELITERSVGRFVFDDVTPGPHTLVIDDPHFERWVQHGVEGGAVVRAQLVGNARLAVDVRSAASGDRIEPTVLRLEYLDKRTNPSHVDLLAPTSGPAPDAPFVVVPGECELVVAAVGFPEQRVPVGTIASGELRAIDVALQPGVVLRGRVLAIDRTRPVNDLEIQITRGALAGHMLGRGATASVNGVTIPAVDFGTRTRADGSFELPGLAPGTWTVRGVWGPYLFADRIVELRAGDDEALEIVEPPSGFVEGDVILPENAVVSALRLDLRSKDVSVRFPCMLTKGAIHGSGLPLTQGSYRVGPVLAGELHASVLAAHPGVNASFGGEGGMLTIEAGRTVRHDLDLRATMRGSVAIGVFVDGAPAKGGYASLRLVGASTKPASAGASIEANGTVVIAGAQPGAYDLWIKAPDETWTWSPRTRVDVAPGARIDLEVRIELARHAVRFIDASGGNALARATIEAVTGDGVYEVASSPTIDEHGTASFTLPIGPVTFRDRGTRASATLDWGRDVATPFVVALTVKD